MGHMNRCLAYARRLRGRAEPVFFSLASAIEIIEQMGFEAEYFVSNYWSASTTYAWNSELARRVGMMLERVRPAVVVFDGTWPFQGFRAACQAFGSPAMVWSNRGLMKADTPSVRVDEAGFDLVIQPGELGAAYGEAVLAGGTKRIVVPPVCVLDDDELLDRAAAREQLGLEANGRYALFSLGPGNLKDVRGIGHGLVRSFVAQGITVVWARAPISVRDVELPDGVKSISVYPLVRYMRAFDTVVGAAGYNTCCEVVQARVPGLLVPNTQLVDDQALRAQRVADHVPAVVSACETESERVEAVRQLVSMSSNAAPSASRCAMHAMPMDGARLAADEILALALRG